MTGANSLWSSTVLADSGGRSCSSRAGFLLGRSWRSDARLRFLSILSDGMFIPVNRYGESQFLVQSLKMEKFIKLRLAEKGGEQKKKKKKRAVDSGN